MKIPSGDSQHNDYLKLNDHIAILRSDVSDETFFVYKNDVESLIAALTKAKQYWDEKEKENA